MKKTFLILVLAFLFQILFVSANAQSSGILTGKITDTQGASIADAVVTIRFQQSGESVTKVSGQKGEFGFSQLTEGDYVLTVNADGFESKRQKASTGRRSVLNIVLLPRHIAAVVSVTSNYLAGTVEALERMPGSIQTIGKEELESARVFNFSEVLRRISGVNIRNEEGFGLRPNISIRGSNPTRSRKVLMLEDGIPLSYAPYGDNSSYYHPPIERFESVEILKGSGQIAYGPVTVAGVINYITPNPSDRPTFKIKLIGGNRDYVNGSMGFSGTFGPTGIVLNLTRKQGEGSRMNLRSGITDFSLKVVQPINARNILVFKYSHFNEDSQLTYSGLTEAEFADDSRQNPFLNDRLNFFREGFSVSHSGVITRDFSVTTNFYTSYFSRDWWRQSSNSDQRPNRLFVDFDCAGIQDLNTTCGNQGTPRDFRVIGLEPRFNYHFLISKFRNELNFGFRAHYETQNRRAFNGDLPNSRDGEITEHNLRNSFAGSVFLQNRFVMDKLSITPGIRIERISFERRNLLNGAIAKTNLTQLIPGIGIAYNLYSKATVFAGLHRGFAPPSTSDILTNSGGVVELKSELSWNYEAGIRVRPFDSASMEATYFKNDYENQIVPASAAGGVGSTWTNAGETLQDGLELNARFDSQKLFDTAYNLYLQTAYTLVNKAEFANVRFSGVSGSADTSITGNRLPYAPRHLATTSFGIMYKSLHGFVENVYVGGQFSDDLNTMAATPNGQRGSIPGQVYFNATMNYQIEKLDSSVFFTSKNIFDRLYIVDRTRGIYPSSPRLIQIGWTWEFSK